MSDVAWALVSLAFVMSVGVVATCWRGVLEQRLDEAKRIRDDERNERERGVNARVEALKLELHAALLEMKTFIANHRAR